MKHIFWIICGVILVALLAAWFFLVPTDAARNSKTELDKQSRDLKELEARAARGDPQGVFDPENPADTQRLASEYLITENWKGKLQPLVAKYEKQSKDIKDQLFSRGAWLHKPVTPTKNVLEWYNAYVAASEALIGRLRGANCMTRAAAEETINANGESPAGVRSSVGLYTKSGSFPDPREHAQLTTRLHALEMIADRLIASRIAVADNPVVGPTGPSEDRARASVMLSAVEWLPGGSEADGGLHPLNTSLSSQVPARALALRLTLTGPLSPLLAASAGLERNAEANRPLIAINSATLLRRESAAAGERFDVADDNVQLIIAIEMIEFIDPAATASSADPVSSLPIVVPSTPSPEPRKKRKPVKSEDE
jgi:hypothetical protein